MCILQRFVYIFLFSAIFLSSLSANDQNIDICSLSFPSFSHTVEKLLPTVVNISTSKSITKKGVDLPDLLPELPENSPFEFFFKDLFGSGIIADKVETVTSLGSGFIISEDGYIVTNNHVLDSAEIVDVKLNDGQIVRARIIGRDIKSDLALLKIKTKDKLPFVEVGDSDNSAVGDWVIAVGNPFGLGGTVTAGIISARGRNLMVGSNIDFIQTDAAINKGNSGGPMFDSKGKLIGVNTAIFSNAAGGNIGIGFAIPANIAIPVIAQLKARGKVIRGWLGVSVQYIDPNMADALGLEEPYGAYVISVIADSPAEKYGLQPDDLIVEISGKLINSPQLLAQIVSATEIGDKLNLKILRFENGKLAPKNIIVEIENIPSEDKKKIHKKTDITYKEYLGLKLTELNKRFRNDYEIPEELNGVLIIGFTDKSKNNTTGVIEGDVISKINQEQIKSFKQLKIIIERNRKFGKKYAVLSIKRGELTVIETVNIE